jgi:hypothetical protein
MSLKPDLVVVDEPDVLDVLAAAAARRVQLEKELAQAREDTHAAIVDALRAKTRPSVVARLAHYDREHIRRIRREAGLMPTDAAPDD